MKKSRFTEAQIVFAVKQAELEQENLRLKKRVVDLSLATTHAVCPCSYALRGNFNVKRVLL
jgi:hypothetical protein